MQQKKLVTANNYLITDLNAIKKSRIAAHSDSFDYALFLIPFKSKNDSSSSLLFIGVKVPVLKNKKT